MRLSPRGLLGLNWSGICCKSCVVLTAGCRQWGSTAVLCPKLILPNHHMYNFVLGELVELLKISSPHTRHASPKHPHYTHTGGIRRTSYSTEKGTFVADFARALWSHCMGLGLPASPSPTHTASLTPLLTSLSLSSLPSRWIRSCCRLLSERAIHCHHTSPPNQSGLERHYLLAFGNMLSMQTFSR